MKAKNPMGMSYPVDHFSMRRKADEKRMSTVNACACKHRMYENIRYFVNE